MKKLGHTITKCEIKDVMDKHDLKKNGYLSYEEFRLIFQNI